MYGSVKLYIYIYVCVCVCVCVAGSVLNKLKLYMDAHVFFPPISNQLFFPHIFPHLK